MENLKNTTTESKKKRSEVKSALKDAAIQGVYLFLTGFVIAAGQSAFGSISHKLALRNIKTSENIIPLRKTA